MGIRVYLKEDPADEKCSFQEAIKASLERDSIFFKDMRLHLDRSTGSWYFDVSTVIDSIPAAFEKMVDYLTLEELITAGQKRELGIYANENAEAELRFSTNSTHYVLRMRAKNWNDLRDLYIAIRTGSARPKQSYEYLQSGLTAEEIKDKLSELTTVRHELLMKERALCLSEEKFQVVITAFKKLIGELKKDWWSFCTKGRIIKAIEEIFTPLNLSE